MVTKPKKSPFIVINLTINSLTNRPQILRIEKQAYTTRKLTESRYANRPVFPAAKYQKFTQEN